MNPFIDIFSCSKVRFRYVESLEARLEKMEELLQKVIFR